MVKPGPWAACWLITLGASCGMPTQAQQGAPSSVAAARRVASVTVEVNGAFDESISSDESPEICRRFLVDTRQVKAFFKRARRISERAYGHDVDASPCHAKGRLKLEDGREMVWKIDRESRGMLSAPGGGEALYFHCPRCTLTSSAGAALKDRSQSPADQR